MRLLFSLLALAFLIGCGGDAPDALPNKSETAASSTPGSTGVPEDAPSGPAGVVVTIGAETFEFDDLGPLGCVRVGGQVSGGGDISGSEVMVSFTIPPEDWETNDRFRNPPRISVIDRRSAAVVQWVADGETSGGVESYAIDAQGVEGTATFVSLDGVTESGSFDIDCGT